MTALFLDTSGWFAAISPKEARHHAARSAYRAAIGGHIRLVTTNLVVAEMHILVSRFRGPEAGVRFLNRLHQDVAHQIVYVDRATERSAIDRWLRTFHGKPLSLTDAVSFEVMRAERIDQALALDAHFGQAGFTLVPA